jgi:hypothetical protein
MSLLKANAMPFTDFICSFVYIAPALLSSLYRPVAIQKRLFLDERDQASAISDDSETQKIG